MNRNTIGELQRLLGIAGVALICLAIPTTGGSPADLSDNGEGARTASSQMHVSLSNSAGKSPATSADPDDAKPFKPIDSPRLLHTMKSETGVPFETFIHFQENGEHFIYASTPPEGSGAFMTEAIFWIAPDATVHPIIFEHAGRAYETQVNEREFILTGGPGILFSDGKLRFEFLIGDKADPRCCPTAGKISGTYKVVGKQNFDAKSKEYNCTFRVVVDKYKRDLLSSDDLSVYANME